MYLAAVVSRLADLLSVLFFGTATWVRLGLLSQNHNYGRVLLVLLPQGHGGLGTTTAC